MNLLFIGHDATLPRDKLLVVLPYNSAPIKALKKEAKEQGRLADATYGKPTRSLLLLENGGGLPLVVLSSLAPETLSKRLTAIDHTANQV